ncbi:MAG TPA: DsbC family protein [Steroidobacteraceae bacterium]|nr:DsbC family protein [Steroidobacteraceae bacterium]
MQAIQCVPVLLGSRAQALSRVPNRRIRFLVLALGLSFSLSLTFAAASPATAAAGALPVNAPGTPAATAANTPAASAKSDIAGTLKQTIESRFPGVHVLDVQPAVVPGLYELYTGDQIVYADVSGEYLLMGPLVQTRTRQNLTEDRLNEHGRIDFSSLPLDRAIRIVKGNGSRRFAVFSDPDCPFCQQLEQSLLSVNDITMYVFLYPIATLHPQAPGKAHAIWCAKDHAQAWSQWMHEKKLPPAGLCAGDPVKDLQQLGDKLRINSTPTMFFANGRRLAGALPAADLERILDETSGVKHAPAAAAPKPTAPAQPAPAAGQPATSPSK